MADTSVGVGASAARLSRVNQSYREQVILATVLCVVAWLAAFLPLVQPLNNIWIAETVFAVIIALAGIGFVYRQQYFRLNRVIPFLGFTIVVALIAAILGATLDASTNGGCFGYEIFAVIVLSFPLLALMFGGLVVASTE